MAYWAQRPTDDAAQAHWVLRVLLLLFLLICVFDPADLMLRAKIPVFIALWLATLVPLVLTRKMPSLPARLLIYVLVFVAIPLTSIGWYYLIDGREPFNGFLLLKGYLFISFVFILFLNRIDLIPQLSMVLTALAVLVIGTFIYLQFVPSRFQWLHDLGISTGLLSLDIRTYRKGFDLIQVNYVTSAMLVVPIAYYFDRARSEPGGKTRLVYSILLVVNIAGLLLSGTRNNMVTSLLLPCALWLLYARRVWLSALFCLVVLVLLALPFASQISAFFDTAEKSNSIKLALLRDYMRLFNDMPTLLFGMGLGAFHSWEAKGSTFYTTELTYLEMIRSFGIFGAAAMLALLLVPPWYAFATPSSRRERALTVAYLFYLLMSISNPLLFSSSGMLILAAVLANIHLDRARLERRAGQRESAVAIPGANGI